MVKLVACDESNQLIKSKHKTHNNIKCIMILEGIGNRVVNKTFINNKNLYKKRTKGCLHNQARVWEFGDAVKTTHSSTNKDNMEFYITKE